MLIKALPIPFFALTFLLPSAQANAADVITLTQTACQFIESENGVDHQYKSSKKADCEAINAKTGTGRLQSAKPITLKAGRYTFRVTNRDVPYELGFWIRDKDYDWKNPLHKLTKTSVSGGGLTSGTSRDYAVDLAPGEYLYSCPLNTTPDYKLIVTE
ncbi:hypothetical protein [Aestuariispira insulae]|uniref:Uncharacterized protein n=1 Tax=Aestuariispira insulae TaxID=1461337 RepID=A0A3D9HFI1_9PROT|nr:hypothetical protein [Aestuariispira insulae]RED48001.1 hypothetical protein DFP90_10818 [Aestuariispira insulae]